MQSVFSPLGVIKSLTLELQNIEPTAQQSMYNIKMLSLCLCLFYFRMCRVNPCTFILLSNKTHNHKTIPDPVLHPKTSEKGCCYFENKAYCPLRLPDLLSAGAPVASPSSLHV